VSYVFKEKNLHTFFGQNCPFWLPYLNRMVDRIVHFGT